jgi:hypothetical protein
MRLWSIHPKYLDPAGLVALWRESLLAKKVLEGRTKGYKKHPQLIRFRLANDPAAAINTYLRDILEESKIRGYSFNAGKVKKVRPCGKISVTAGQLKYEMKWLKNKLIIRNPLYYQRVRRVILPESAPIFRKVAGKKEPWEGPHKGLY